MKLNQYDIKVLEKPQFDDIPDGPLLPIILENGN